MTSRPNPTRLHLTVPASHLINVLLLGMAASLCLASAIYLHGCKSGPTEPPPKNPREYTWTIDTLEYPGSFQTLMTSIWGSSSSDLYIVGHNDQQKGQMWHFDGKKWTDIPQHHPDDRGNAAIDLSTITGLSGNNLYVVGKHRYTNYQPPPDHLDTSLVIHYDGQSWREEKLLEKGVELRSISASAPNDIWTCGRNGTLYHFDGTAWRRDSVKLSVPSGGDYYLWDIKANPYSTEVYLLGYIHQNEFARTTRYFFIRRNAKWNLVDSMVFEPGNIVPKFGHGGFWVSPNGMLYSFGGIIFRWSGTTWTSLLNTGIELRGMAGTSDRNIFAVGSFGIVRHYNGTDWYLFEGVHYTDLVYSSAWTDGREVFVVGFTIAYPQKTVVLRGR